MAEKAQKTASIQDVYNGYAKEASAKEPKIVSLTETHTVKFTQDFKEIKAGTIFKDISQVAFDFYIANGVVEEVKNSKN